MTDEEIVKMIEEEYGHCCNYCEKYNALIGCCEFDKEDRRPDDGERCIIFEWDDLAIELLKNEYAMQSQVGKVESEWTRWLRRLTN